MEIKTVAILGAGAIGSYFIEGLRDKCGENLWIIAEGERKERLQKNGIVINGETIPLHVKTPEEAHGVDLLIVCVKYGALSDCIPMVKQIVDEHTICLSPLNGVESEEIIGKEIGMEHMVYSLMKIAAERDGNAIRYNPEKTLGFYYGDIEKNNEKEEIQAIAALLSGTRVRFTLSEDIARDIWFKYALNISRNLPQAMIDCGYGAYENSEYVDAISKKLREEVVAVAAAKGIDISDDSASVGNNNLVHPTARFSTLQDLNAKRHTEIDMFSGAMVRMGKECNVPTPFNEFVFYVIKALEEKNDGKFQFS